MSIFYSNNTLIVGVLLSIILLFQQADYSYGLFENHKINSANTWLYVTKFCFNPDSHEATGKGSYKGEFKYKITFPLNTTSLAWYVYFHDSSSWDKAYNTAGDCFDKGNVAYENGNVFKLSWHPNKTIDSKVVSDMFPSGVANVVNGNLVFYSKRPRWFYFALGNCNSPLNKDGKMSRAGSHNQDSIKALVELEMLNGFGPEMHFSADELGKLSSYTSFCVLYLLLLCCPVLYTVMTLRKRKMLHHTVKILVLSMFLELISIIFGLMYQSSYAIRGYKYTPLEATSALFHAGADCSMVILLLVIAKGWTIVRRKISARGRVKLGMFCTLYAATYYAVLIWHYNVGKDPASVTYLYDSPPGSVLQWLRVVAIVWFMYACHTTKVNYTTKKGFYFGFFIIGALWFAALPLQVLIANNLLQLWYRSAFVTNVELTLNLLFYVGFTMFFWPSTFNRNFPFHAKTSDMEEPVQPNRRGRKRKPSNTLNASGGGNRFGNHNTTEIRGATSASSSSMPHPAGFNLVNVNNNNNNGRNSRRSISGGLAIGEPETRIQNAIKVMRSKLAALHDVSDDIEFALGEIAEPLDEEDQDFDVPSEEGQQQQKGWTKDDNDSDDNGDVEMVAKKKKKKKKPRPPV